MTTRDQLIADWQKRLGAASSTPDEPTSRAAWLSRLRFRLYRFLLSLYGDGRWNAATDDDAEQPRGGVVIDDQALPLAGKPAKAPGKIQSVLKSVVSAQDRAAEQGPLATELNDPWVVVACTSDGLDVERCAQQLNAKGIVARVIGRSADTTLEVRKRQQFAATKLIAEQGERLKLREWEPPRVDRVRGQPAGTQAVTPEVSVLVGIMAGPVGAMLAIAGLHILLPPGADPIEPALLAAIALTACVGCGVIVGTVHREISLAAPKRKAKTPPGCVPRRTTKSLFSDTECVALGVLTFTLAPVSSISALLLVWPPKAEPPTSALLAVIAAVACVACGVTAVTAVSILRV